jgi:hypothetical protein
VSRSGLLLPALLILAACPPVRELPRPARPVVRPRPPAGTLPPDARPVFLGETAPLPLPDDVLLVHLDLAATRRSGGDPRALVAGAGMADAGNGQLLPYLARCRLDPAAGLPAVTLGLPVGAAREEGHAVILWGVPMPRGVVGCLAERLAADGARSALRPIRGEPARWIDRPASGVHLLALALDEETVLVVSGAALRDRLLAVLEGRAGALAATAAYRTLVASAPPGRVVSALLPAVPAGLRRALGPAAPLHLARTARLHATRLPAGPRAALWLDLGQASLAEQGRARLPLLRWALGATLDAAGRAALAGLAARVEGTELRVELPVGGGVATALGRQLLEMLRGP